MCQNKKDNNKHPISLARRFTRVGIISISVIFILAGCMLWWIFEHSAKQGLSSYLSAIINTLIASTLQDEDTNAITLADTTKSLNYLPYYWQVTSNNQPIGKSPSLTNYHQTPSTIDGNTEWIRFTIEDNLTIFAIKRSVTFPGDVEVTYVFGINEQQASYFLDLQRSQFLPLLTITLTCLAALLITLIFWQIKVSMQPFTVLKNAIAAIKSGESEKLPDHFPLEIQPLTTELNSLIDHNHSILERYRQFASNLSHALKTPLTVLKNEAAAPHDMKTLTTLVTDKTAHMNKLIERYLSRARISGTSHLFSAPINIQPILASICKNFEKIYPCSITLTYTNAIPLVIDTEDAYELFGNLIENACKYGHGQVTVTATIDKHELTIAIDDNGKGIEKNKRHDAVKRGIRLDQQQQGSGIGIPIAVDIAKLYGATLMLDDSDMGGLCVKLIFALHHG